jgi:hypothetical protein
MGLLVRSGNVPDVYLVSTSWAWGIPRAACEAEVLGHDQAQQMKPRSTQQASRIGWEDLETARHEEERDLVRHHTGA